MAKRTIAQNEPPKRPAPEAGNKLDAHRVQDDADLVGISHRIPRHHVTYLRMLAIQTGREQRDLLSEALDLLRKHHGDI